MEVKRILVPISFAPSSDKAFTMAARMAAAFGAKLYVMNVYKTLPRLFHSVGGVFYTKDLEQQRAERIKELDDFVKMELGELRLKMDVEEIEVMDRDAVDAILKVAKDYKADILVLGHHEEMALEHLLFGRNIDKLVEEAPCDVMVTRTELYAKEKSERRAA